MWDIYKPNGPFIKTQKEKIKRKKSKGKEN